MVSSISNPLLLDQAVFTPRKIRMICVGAGFSGLMLAYGIKTNPANSFIDLQILEKNGGIGGTWYENKYPGAACDVPSHIYTFPFAPNPNWTKFYSSSSQILHYIEDTTDKFELRQYVQLKFRVISTIWSDTEACWDVTYEKTDELGNLTTIPAKADVLVNACGILNRKKWPDIPGLDSFNGQILHSAAWDDKIDCTGKTIGVIGNGSSAIQIIPQIQPKAKHIYEYIRTPTYIIPEFLSEFTPDGTNFEYTAEQKKEYTDPIVLRDMRRKMEHAFKDYFKIFKTNAPAQAYVREVFTQLMRSKIHSEELMKLVPDWFVGCRRITPGHGYLEALQEPNATVRFGAIKNISENGVVMDGWEDKLDILICATGSDVSFSPAWEISGQNGVQLADLWSKDPEGYLGIFAPSMPNYFIYNGPNCPIGHGSLMGALESTTAFILSMTRKLASQGYRSVCVKDEVVKEYNEYTQEWLKDTVWASGCSSWYKRASDGRVTAMYAGSVLRYREMLANVRLEDFAWQSEGNRFRFMGTVQRNWRRSRGCWGTTWRCDSSAG